MSDNGIKATSKGVIVFLVITILLLLGIAGGTVVFWNKVSAETVKMEAKKKQVEEAQRMALSIEESKLEYSDVQSQLQNLEQNISTEEYIPTLLSQMESLCQSVDMKVLSVRPVMIEESKAKKSKDSKSSDDANAPKDADASKDTPGKEGKKANVPSQPFYKEQKIDIEVGGYYLNALDLIYKITSFPKIVAVNSVQMSPAVSSARGAFGSPPLKVQMSVIAFILNEPTDKPTEPTATADDKAGTSEGAGNEAR
jgi:Tfp pilus assembly protein PilO